MHAYWKGAMYHLHPLLTTGPQHFQIQSIAVCIFLEIQHRVYTDNFFYRQPYDFLNEIVRQWNRPGMAALQQLSSVFRH